MRHRSKRGSLVDDCLLAAFALAMAAVPLVAFGRFFSWQATFAILIVPTCLLCCHLRYRAAALSAATALLTGAWIIVPPRWSLRIEAEAIPAVLIYACAATLMVTLPACTSHRKRRQPSLITPVPAPRRA